MKILVDADGCPVVDFTAAEAIRRGLECVLVCDTAHVFARPGTRTVTVSQGADSADLALANLAVRGDLVVTQDYGLAALCLARGARVLSQNGLEYCDANLDGLLAERHAAQRLRAAGGRTRGPRKRTAAQNEAFCAQLRRLLDEMAGGVPARRD